MRLQGNPDQTQLDRYISKRDPLIATHGMAHEQSSFAHVVALFQLAIALVLIIQYHNNNNNNNKSNNSNNCMWRV